MSDEPTNDPSIAGTAVPVAGAPQAAASSQATDAGPPPFNPEGFAAGGSVGGTAVGSASFAGAPAAGAPEAPIPAGTADVSGLLDAVRIEQFRSEIDHMGFRGSSVSTERWLLWVGAVLLIGGIALALLGAIQVVDSGDSAPDQRAAMASGSLLGIVMVIAGSALFLRYSFVRYMRLWLIRLVYENRSDTDRLVAVIERASGLGDSAAPSDAPQDGSIL